MTYQISTQKSVQILQVNELFNEFDNKAILNDVDTCIQEGYNRFVVDLSDLNFLNSVGLNFLLAIMTRSKSSGGGVAVANASEQVVNLLEMTRLRHFFNLSPNVESAVATLTHP
ncbi:MAG: STAS domain-containing protein [Bacteroidota bacterium]